MGQDFHYSVLFTRTERQEALFQILSEAFPAERGKIFLPKWEFWRRDQKRIDQKALFPGYLFFYTDMDALEIHEFLRPLRGRAQAFVKELGAARAGFSTAADEESEELSDLTPEESRFFDLILDDEGVERMSYGYLDPKVIVMEGPLAAFENAIARRNLHERTASLTVSFREFEIQAGLTIYPKAHYFPECGEIGVLSDGSEIDLTELKKRMMDGRTVYRPR